MLSTRVLHFGRYEMFFECRSSIDCECSLIRFQGAGFETMLPLIKVEHADALTQYTNDRRESGQVEVRYQGARLWRTMVSCYTALALTKSTDRLIAFGGLARQMANSRRSEYLAGVWRDSLQDDLLWDVRTTSRLKKSRPQPRNAPTWSWASVETAVGYWDIIVFTDLEGNAVEERAPFEHFTTIEDCRVSKTSIDEFGSITQGHLTITGLVVEGLLEREVETFENTERINHSISILGSQLPIASDYFLDHDGPNKVDPGSAILCLRMSLYQEQSKQCLYSLILRQCPLEPNIFERIGTLRISGSIGSVDPDSGIFHGAQTRTVVIA
ncbi:hypothetical protein BKA66DRAFT_475838 [Pyrenochaeta sp. MPI-SDFR-AT-0127]|nr:hypothetical protein BKA66DRAFT_475838 [Pyrenochaeta sp. MPI-SDFR-AT-0127]